MANIFQESVGEIKTTPYVSTEQEDVVTPAAITAIGETALDIDRAREKSKLIGTPEDEVPFYWDNIETEGPHPMGEGRKVYQEVKRYDPSADLNLTQVVKARDQGLMSANEAQLRIESAFRVAVNRRPGRYNELKEAADKFTGLYDGILSEAAAEKQQTQHEEYLWKLNMQSMAQTGLNLDERITYERSKTAREAAAMSSSNKVGELPATLARSRINDFYLAATKIAELPPKEQADAILALRNEVQIAMQEDQAKLSNSFLDDTQRKESIGYYTKPMDEFYKSLGNVDFATRSKSINDTAKEYGLSKLMQSVAPELIAMHDTFGRDASTEIFGVINQAKKALLLPNNIMRDEELKKIEKNNGFYGVIGVRLAHLGEEAVVKGAAAETKQIKIAVDSVTQPDLPLIDRITGMEMMAGNKDLTADQGANVLALQLRNYIEDARTMERALHPDMLALFKKHPDKLQELRNIYSSKFIELNMKRDYQTKLIKDSKRIMAGSPGMFPQEDNGWRSSLESNMTRNDALLAQEQASLEKVAAYFKWVPPGVQEETDAGVKKTQMKTDIDKLYTALASAETGGESDPFIRTKVRTAPGGSSAYGPVQITKSLAAGMLTRHKDQFSEDEQEYLSRFIDQGKLFLKYGNVEGADVRYDYGGGGDLTSEEDRAMYEKIAKKFIQIELDASGGNVDTFLKRWRGADPEPWYSSRVKSTLKETS